MIWTDWRRELLMSPFGLMRLPRTVTFGRGQRRAVGDVAAQIGRRALVCTDQRLAAVESFRSLLTDLSRAGVTVQVYDRTQPDLPVESLLDCVSQVGDFAPDVLI